MKTPWAVILCKFTDDDVEPFPMEYYHHLFTEAGGGSEWNMPRYFRDWSHGTLDLSESQVFGWYQLDKSVADYNGLGSGARAKLIEWARAAATADGVDLSPFFSVVACTNLWQDIGAVATGAVAQGPLTQNPGLLAHEMGHVYGMPHSRIDGSDDDYQDRWDIMSAANTFTALDPEFGNIGPGVSAWNMRAQGWLDESRVWKAPEGAFDETITLRPLVARKLSGYLAAELGEYLVEFRLRAGWDGGIPRPAVLIHRAEGEISYIMRGEAGVPDLVAGDGFGSPELDGSVMDLFSAFNRIDVISIDPVTQEAVVRIRHHPPVISRFEWRAVDPMSLVLSTKAYLTWLEIHEPRGPRVADIQVALKEMTPLEQRVALTRARALAEYGQAVEEAFRELGTATVRVGEKVMVQAPLQPAVSASRTRAG